MFKKPAEVWEDQMNELFLSKSKEENNRVIEALSIILGMNYGNKNKDIIDLFNLLGLDNFVSVVTLFERRTVTFPSKEEIKESIIFALIFYYRETKGYSWEEIKNIVPFEFSSISYAFKIKNLNSFIIDKLKETLKDTTNE
jgi:hypothetical protein